MIGRDIKCAARMDMSTGEESKGMHGSVHCRFQAYGGSSVNMVTVDVLGVFYSSAQSNS